MQGDTILMPPSAPVELWKMHMTFVRKEQLYIQYVLPLLYTKKLKHIDTFYTPWPANPRFNQLMISGMYKRFLSTWEKVRRLLPENNLKTQTQISETKHNGEWDHVKSLEGNFPSRASGQAKGHWNYQCPSPNSAFVHLVALPHKAGFFQWERLTCGLSACFVRLWVNWRWKDCFLSDRFLHVFSVLTSSFCEVETKLNMNSTLNRTQVIHETLHFDFHPLMEEHHQKQLPSDL